MYAIHVLIRFLYFFKRNSFTPAIQKSKYDIELTEKRLSEVGSQQDYDPYKNRNVEHPTT